MTEFKRIHRKQEANSFLTTLFTNLVAGEQIEVRYKLPGNATGMNRGFYTNPTQALQEVLRLAPVYDVYIGVAPRKGSQGTKEGVTRLFALWADLDVKDGHTSESRLKQLQSLPYPPSIIVWSSGGFHPYWLLAGPAEGSKEFDQAEKIMSMFADGLAGDAVQDRSRILRVPGTYNHKQVEARPVTLVECHPDRHYNLDQLEEMAEALPRKKTERTKRGRSGKVQQSVLSVPIKDGQRNVVLASVAGSLRDRGLDEESIRIVLLEVNRLRCTPSLEDAEVSRIARSVSRYSSGSPRYRRSTVRRIYRNGEGR